MCSTQHCLNTLAKPPRPRAPLIVSRAPNSFLRCSLSTKVPSDVPPVLTQPAMWVLLIPFVVYLHVQHSRKSAATLLEPLALTPVMDAAPAAAVQGLSISRCNSSRMFICVVRTATDAA